MDLKKLDAVQERLSLAVIDAKNHELNNLEDSKQMVYLSSVLTDLVGCLYGMFTVTYGEDLDKAIGLAQSEVRRSIVEHYLEMKKITESNVD